jgi:ActR/RegA family two-component response regulator
VSTIYPSALAKMNASESPETQRHWHQENPAPSRQPISGYPHLGPAPHVLIVSSDEALAASLMSILEESDIAAEYVTTVTEGCTLAESGLFQVVLTEPALADGTWRRFNNSPAHRRLQFAVVLIAKGPDLRQRVRALKDGAFDVIDALNDLSKAAEVVIRALWVEYLNGLGPGPESIRFRGK